MEQPSLFEFTRGTDAPSIRAITSISRDRVVCRLGVWRSWLWQCRKYPHWTRNATPAVRFWLDDNIGEVSLTEAACYKAWWRLPRTVVAQYAKETGVRLPPGSNLFQTLFAVVSETLKLGEDESMAICLQRCVGKGDADVLSEALLDMDEASDLRDKTDIDALKLLKKKAKREGDEAECYLQSYTAKLPQINEAKKKAAEAAASASAASSSSAAAQSAPRSGGELSEWTFVDSQPHLKAFLPPGASIWRMKQRGGWCGHNPPFPRISEKFSQHPDQESAVTALIGRLWAMHRLSNMEPKECPWERFRA